MRQGRLLLVVALVLIIVAGGGTAAYFLLQPPPPADTTPPPIEVTATPEPILNVIVAAQDINRGVPVPTEALSIYPWPTAIVPLGAITDASTIVGTRARIDIDRGMPILENMVVPSLLQLSPTGSDAAAQIPPGFQAIALPYDRRNGVAQGIEDGDHVNVIVTWWVVDIDENFQSILPNLTANVSPPSPGDATLGIPPGVVAIVVDPAGGKVGRGETDSTTGEDFYVVPAEAQRPRAVVQTMIQDSLVLHVGDFVEALFPTILPPTPTVGEGTPEPPPPAPTNTPLPPDSITLVVAPQDVLVLNYVKEMMVRYPGAVQMTLALRSAGDTSTVETESVTLQYMFERFRITLPAKLPYGPAAPSATPAPTAP